MATTKTAPAEVAWYGSYWMMKRGKSVAVYGSWYKFLTSLLVRITLRFALRRLMRYLKRLGRTAATQRKRITGMKEKPAQFAEKGAEGYARV